MISNIKSIIKRRKYSKKNLLSFALYFTAIIPLIRLLQKYNPTNRLMILNYHRVVSSDEDIKTDLGVISAIKEDFEKQINYLKKHYNVISSRDLIENIKGEKKLPINSVLITFDDGYIDVYLHAYNILKKHNFSAIVFLPTDYIGSSELFWWDELALLLRAQDVDTEIIRKTLNTVHDMSKEKKKEFLEKIRNDCKKLKLSQCEKRLILNWDEIREISNYGIEFGSHTCSHIVMAKSDLNSIKREVIDSTKLISEKLNKSTQIFSYPRGRPADFNNQHYDILREAGIELAVSSIEGINKGNIENYRLKRLSVTLNQTIYSFAARLCGFFLYQES